MKLSTQKTITGLSLIVAFSLFFSTIANSQQAVTGIITDYNTFWKTSTASVNPVKPNNSHNLLAFTYNGTQYSTGVNDALLSNRAENYVQGDFWGLPVDALSGTLTSNTKVGLGEMYDGVHNGASHPAPLRDINAYLTDGIKGLNIGTCIANLPVGTLTFFVHNIKPQHIGDGIPDIIVTQVADPSNSHDRYSFTDAGGNIIGQAKDIVFNNINPVANWTADFYEANSNPMVLTSGFTNTDRPVRLWAADLADFGINQSNYMNIHNFRINLSGNSDVAFVAYNNKTFSVNTVPLPVKLSTFSAKESAGKGLLNWSTASESNSRFFIIEKSNDNSNFTAIDTVMAAGNSSSAKNYNSIDLQLKAGANYYRLKMVDLDGFTEYSKTVQVTGPASKSLSIQIFPNPATSSIQVSHPRSEASALLVYGSAGNLVLQAPIARGSQQTTIDVSNLQKGVYYVQVGTKNGQAFIKK